MYFESVSEILSMAGHGVYVWSAYAVSVVVIAALLVQPAAAYRQQIRQLKMRADASRATDKQ